MNEATILQTVDDLDQARRDELDKGFILADAKAAVTAAEGGVEARKRAAVAQAYRDGVIDGKNQDIRKAQEMEVIQNDHLIGEYDQDLSSARDKAIQAQRTYDEAVIGRKKYEALFSAQRAILVAFGIQQD